MDRNAEHEDERGRWIVHRAAVALALKIGTEHVTVTPAGEDRLQITYRHPQGPATARYRRGFWDVIVLDYATMVFQHDAALVADQLLEPVLTHGQAGRQSITELCAVFMERGTGPGLEAFPLLSEPTRKGLLQALQERGADDLVAWLRAASQLCGVGHA